jgi:DNA replication and repair protein RecF
LKRFGESGRYDPDLMDIMDAQLIQSGEALFKKRRSFMETFTPIFNTHYSFISDDAERVELVYESQLLSGEFADLLKKNAEKDKALERTTTGIHKDELLFNIGNMPIKKFGSQGQQKSFLIALKLAQYSFLYQKKGFKPLLLLDDIFDKLDHNRVTKLMQMVSNNNFGQVFITDTSITRVEQIFSGIDVAITIFKVKGGEIYA